MRGVDVVCGERGRGVCVIFLTVSQEWVGQHRDNVYTAEILKVLNNDPWYVGSLCV